MFVDLWWLFSKLFSQEKLPSLSYPSFLFLLLFIGIFFKIINWFFNKLDYFTKKIETDIEKFSAGVSGENTVFKELTQILNPDEYKVYRNIVLPEARGDIDLLLVGPTGIGIIEVKKYSTKTIFSYNKAQYVNNFGLIRFLLKDNRWQVFEQSLHLSNYLNRKGIKVSKINKAILYIDPDSVKFNEMKNKYKVYVIRGIQNLKVYLNGLFKKGVFTKEHMNKVVDLLSEIKKPEKFDNNLPTGSSINFIK